MAGVFFTSTLLFQAPSGRSRLQSTRPRVDGIEKPAMKRKLPGGIGRRTRSPSPGVTVTSF